MATLEISGITKTFGATPVLRGIDLEIGHGEFIAVVGPSGCGKSTLLRLIAGLDAQDAGSIRIDAASVDGQPPKARDIAMVFQSYALYPHMTVAQNIALPLIMRDLTRTERLPLARRLLPGVAGKRAAIRAAVADASELVSMSGYLDRKPKQLSGGQRQRVALARALVRKPRLFLLDEPLSNLDAALRISTRAEIAALQRRLGITTIYVTHDQGEAMTMADRIVVMMDGAIVQVGTPRQIYEAPGDSRVARFIGSPPISLLPAEIVDTAVHVDGCRLPIRVPGATDAAVQLGMRPEHATLAAPGSGVLSGTVRQKEFLGAEELVHVSIGHLAEATLVVRHVADAPSPALGTRVGIVIAAEKCFLFGPDGRRLAAQPEVGAATPETRISAGMDAR